jgi:hypothetical protein
MSSGDDLAIILFFISTAISIALAAMTAAGWTHPLYYLFAAFLVLL